MRRWVLLFFCLLWGGGSGWWGCGPSEPGPAANAEVPFGKLALVVVINPTSQKPGDLLPVGEERAGVPLEIRRQESSKTRTDTTGMQVITGVTGGSLALVLPGGDFPLVGVGEKEIIDLAFSLKDGVTNLAMLRYPKPTDEKKIFTPKPGARIGSLDQPGSAYLLKEGTFPDPGNIAGTGLMFIGAGASKTTVTGNITVQGNKVRLRSVKFKGDLTIQGSDVSLAFCEVVGNLTILGNRVILLRSRVSGKISASGSQTRLLDVNL